jgi:hypothetical protein
MTETVNKNPLSVRARPATKADLARLAGEGGIPPSTLLAFAADLIAGDYIRCRQCDAAVPVTLGDLSGRRVRDLVAKAEKAVRYQKCWSGRGPGRTPAHTPVFVGAGHLKA